MPETKEAEATTPDAASIYASMSEEEKSAGSLDNEEPKTEPEEETPEEDVSASEDDTDEDATDADEVDEEELATAKLTLDDNVREALPQDVAKRYDQHVKGLEKIERRLRAGEDDFNAYQRLDAAIVDKKESPLAVQSVIKFALEKTGLSLRDLLGDFAPTTEQEVDDEGRPKSKYGFTWGTEDAIYEKAKADALKEMQEKFGLDPDLINDLKTEREQKKQAESDKAWFQSKGNVVIARIEKQNNWKVSEAQILGARIKNPDLFKKDPFQALKEYDADSYIASQLKKEKKQVPDMLKGNTRTGFVSPKPGQDYDAFAAARELGIID